MNNLWERRLRRVNGGKIRSGERVKITSIVRIQWILETKSALGLPVGIAARKPGVIWIPLLRIQHFIRHTGVLSGEEAIQFGQSFRCTDIGTQCPSK